MEIAHDCRFRWRLDFFALAAVSMNSLHAEEPGLIGYWQLNGDCRDSSGREHHGTNLYINGQLVSTSTPTNDAWDLTNSAPLRIGFGQSNYFTGSLCEVRLYNRALTGTEVSQIKSWQKQTPTKSFG